MKSVECRRTFSAAWMFAAVLKRLREGCRGKGSKSESMSEEEHDSTGSKTLAFSVKKSPVLHMNLNAVYIQHLPAREVCHPSVTKLAMRFILSGDSQDFVLVQLNCSRYREISVMCP